MSHDASTRSSDVKAIVSMIAILAGAVSLIGLVLDHMSIDSSQDYPIATARATSHAAVPNKAVAAVPQAEEPWAADESARGTRPEATH